MSDVARLAPWPLRIAQSALGAGLASMAIRMAGMALFFAQSVLLARLLGPADFGMLAVVLTMVELAGVFALCGLGIYAIREVPRLQAVGDIAGIAPFWRSGLHTILLASLMAASAMLVTALVWGDGYAVLMLLAAPLVPAVALGQFLRGIVQGGGRPLAAQWPGEVLRPLLACLALVLMAAGMVRGTASHALAAVVIAGVLACAVAWRQLRSMVADIRPRLPAPGEAQRWRREALPLLGTALAQMLHVALATLLLGALSGAQQAGLFQPVARIAPLLLIPAQAMAMHYAPQIAGWWESGQTLALRKATQGYTRLSTVLTLAIGISLIVLGPVVLWAFGPEFAVGAPMLLVVAAAQVLACALGPTGWLLAMTGQEVRLLHGYLAALAVQAALGLWLIPTHGAWGATIALAGGIIALPALQLWQVRRHLGFDCTILARSKP